MKKKHLVLLIFGIFFLLLVVFMIFKLYNPSTSYEEDDVLIRT